MPINGILNHKQKCEMSVAGGPDVEKGAGTKHYTSCT